MSSTCIKVLWLCVCEEWLKWHLGSFLSLSPYSPALTQSAGRSSAKWASWRRGLLLSSKCTPASGPRPSWRFVEDDPDPCLTNSLDIHTRSTIDDSFPSGVCVFFHVRLWQEVRSHLSLERQKKKTVRVKTSNLWPAEMVCCSSPIFVCVV